MATTVTLQEVLDALKRGDITLAAAQKAVRDWLRATDVPMFSRSMAKRIAIQKGAND